MDQLTQDKEIQDRLLAAVEKEVGNVRFQEDDEGIILEEDLD